MSGVKGEGDSAALFFDLADDLSGRIDLILQKEDITGPAAG